MQFHFTPTYSSWLNQVEIWFSKIEREIIARGIFTSVVPDLPRKLRRYINAHSANARPQKIFIHGVGSVIERRKLSPDACLCTCQLACLIHQS